MRKIGTPSAYFACVVTGMAGFLTALLHAMIVGPPNNDPTVAAFLGAMGTALTISALWLVESESQHD